MGHLGKFLSFIQTLTNEMPVKSDPEDDCNMEYFMRANDAGN